MWYNYIGKKVLYAEKEYYVHNACTFTNQTMLEIRPVNEDGTISENTDQWLVRDSEQVTIIGEYDKQDRPTTFLDRDIKRISSDAVNLIGRVTDELRWSLMQIKYGSYCDNPLPGTRLANIHGTLEKLETLINVRNNLPASVQLPKNDI